MRQLFFMPAPGARRFQSSYLAPMQSPPARIAPALAALGIKALNPMQEAALAAAETHANLLLLSGTGTGKTLAFLLPLLTRLDAASKATQALVIVPSRELALQVEAVWRGMKTGFKITATYGGHKREIEENALVEAPALIVGTPGRIADHLRRGSIVPDRLETLVLDEWDKTLEQGFGDEVAEIVAALPAVQRRLLTSATEGTDIPDFLGFTDAHRVDFLTTAPSDALTVQLLHSPTTDKADTLFRFLCGLGGRPVIVFCNHRDAVDRLAGILKERGVPNVAYHGALEQWDREAALAKFRNGTAYVLVATDLAARGLDVPHIRAIVHYHLPDTPETWTHRNGRTARMDASGTAVLLLGPEETAPPYVSPTAEALALPEGPALLPDVPKWTTLLFHAGKKAKLGKGDVVGFLTGPGGIRAEDIGPIETKDFVTYAAVRRAAASTVLHRIGDERIKGKKVRVEVVK